MSYAYMNQPKVIRRISDGDQDGGRVDLECFEEK